MSLHSFDSSLNVARFHGYRGAETARAVALHTVLRQNLAHSQRSKHRDVAFACDISRQGCDLLLKLAYLSDKRDDENQIREHRQQDKNAKSITSDRWFGSHQDIPSALCQAPAGRTAGWAVVAGAGNSSW